MIFLYHNVLPDDSPPERLCAGQAITQRAFTSHCNWLSQRFKIVSLVEYLASSDRRRLAAITFDDGYRVTYETILPVLEDRGLPVTIFVSTGHLEKGELLWFSILKALSFESGYSEIQSGGRNFSLTSLPGRVYAWESLREEAVRSGNPRLYSKSLAERYPLPDDLELHYTGMTFDQVSNAERSGLVEIGAHTITHPFLNQMTVKDQTNEIAGSGEVLAKLTGHVVRYFAYPGGIYQAESINLVCNAGFEAAFAVTPHNPVTVPRYELGRVGIYSPSIIKLALKSAGLARVARLLGIRFG